MKDEKQVFMLIGAALLGWTAINFNDAYAVRDSDPAVFYQVVGAGIIGAFLVWGKLKEYLFDEHAPHASPATRNTGHSGPTMMTPEEYARYLEEVKQEQAEIHESKHVREAQCKLRKDMDHVIALAPTLSDSEPPQDGADLWDKLTSLVRKVNYADVHRADDHG